MLKRFIGILFTIMFFVSCFTIPPVCAAEPGISVSTTTPDASGEFEAIVSISNNPGISLYDLELHFDKTKITPVEITQGAGLWYELPFLPGVQIPVGSLTSNALGSGLDLAELDFVTALWTNTQIINGTANIATNGVLFTVKFKIIRPIGTTELSLTNNATGNAALETVNFEISGTTVQLGKELDFVITVVNGGNGVIKYEGDEVNDVIMVGEGENITLEFEPDPGYELTSVTVNGTPYITAASITLENMSDNCTVVAKFSPQTNDTQISLGNSIDVYPAGAVFYGTLQMGESSDPVSSFGFEVKGDGISSEPTPVEIPMEPDRIVFEGNIGQFGVRLNFVGDALEQNSFWVRLFFTCGEGTAQYNDGGAWTKVTIIGEG